MAESEKRNRGPYKRNRRGNHSHHHDKQRQEDEKETEPVEITPALKIFKEYQTELDRKHDKYERLVKISRDVTIESKRIIFLLHRIQGDSEKVLEEAETRLKTLQDNLISKIAHELKGESVHQFLRSFSPGLQEFIEAVAFYLFIKEERLVSMEEVTSRLTFLQKQDKIPPKKMDSTQDEDNKVVPGEAETNTSKNVEKTPDQMEIASRDVSDVKDGNDQEGAAQGDDREGTVESQLEDSVKKSESQKDDGNEKDTQKTVAPPNISLPLPPLEVMLGLADFTGELMRLCINTVGGGDLDRPFQLLGFMRLVTEGFQLLGNQAGREMTRKSTVMRQSLKKMEDACYVIRVRGSEMPKHMLKDAINVPTDRDSGYDQEAM